MSYMLTMISGTVYLRVHDRIMFIRHFSFTGEVDKGVTTVLKNNSLTDYPSHGSTTNT